MVFSTAPNELDGSTGIVVLATENNHFHALD